MRSLGRFRELFHLGCFERSIPWGWGGLFRQPVIFSNYKLPLVDGEGAARPPATLLQCHPPRRGDQSSWSLHELPGYIRDRPQSALSQVRSGGPCRYIPMPCTGLSVPWVKVDFKEGPLMLNMAYGQHFCGYGLVHLAKITVA